jgi:hypothetical protein
VSIGLVLSAAFNVAFAFVPAVVGVQLGSQGNPGGGGGGGGSRPNAALLQWLWFATYFLNGLTGALAETSCITVVASTFKDQARSPE